MVWGVCSKRGAGEGKTPPLGNVHVNTLKRSPEGLSGKYASMGEVEKKRRVIS